MRKLFLALLFIACNNDSARVAALETALKECRAQSALTIRAVPPVSRSGESQFSTLTVDYSQSWSDVGREFDDVDPSITDEHFPSEPVGTQQVAVAPLKLHRDGEMWIPTDEMRERLEVQGMRPATARELRSFAKMSPDYQRQFHVVALGSSWVRPNGVRNVSYLNNWYGKRGLDLSWADGDWNSHWRFLAVRK